MRKGFTLIEVIFAMIVVGIAVASLVGANMAFSQNNFTGDEMSTSELLLEQARELTMATEYADLSNLDEVVYSPPIDAAGNTLTDFSQYSQKFVIQNVSSSDFKTPVTDGSTDFLKVTIEIYKGARIINSSNWIRAAIKDI